MVPFHPGRHDQQPVGTDQRRQHPGTARQRRGHQGTADGTEPDPHPVVHAERRCELAGQPGRHPRPLARRRAGQLGEQRYREDVERERRRYRVAGRAEHRGLPDDPEHDRVPGPDGDPVHGQHAFRRHYLRRVVVPPGTGPGDHDQQIAPGGGRSHGGSDPGRVVRLDRQHLRLAAESFADRRGQSDWILGLNRD